MRALKKDYITPSQYIHRIHITHSLLADSGENYYTPDPPTDDNGEGDAGARAEFNPQSIWTETKW